MRPRFNGRNGGLTLASTKRWAAQDVKSVELLGCGQVKWSMGKNGLTITPHEKPKTEHAFVFKITCTQPVSQMPAGPVDQQSSGKANENATKYGLVAQGGGKLSQ